MKIFLEESDLLPRVFKSNLTVYKLEDFDLPSKLIWKASYICFENRSFKIVYKDRYTGYTEVVAKMNSNTSKGYM